MLRLSSALEKRRLVAISVKIEKSIPCKNVLFVLRSCSIHHAAIPSPRSAAMACRWASNSRVKYHASSQCHGYRRATGDKYRHLKSKNVNIFR